MIFSPFSHLILHTLGQAWSVLYCSRTERDLRHNFIVCLSYNRTSVLVPFLADVFWLVLKTTMSHVTFLVLNNLVSQKLPTSSLFTAVWAPCCPLCLTDQMISFFCEAVFCMFEDHYCVLRFFQVSSTWNHLIMYVLSCRLTILPVGVSSSWPCAP